MAGTALGAAIDYLVSALQNGVTTPKGTVIPPLSATDATVVVGDDIPAQDSQSWFVIGRQGLQVGLAAEVTAAHVTLGALRIDETWTIDWFAACYRPGPDQKPARDAVKALYDAFVLLLQADLSLGGAIGDGYAEITRLLYDQTQDTADGGASGATRKALIGGSLTFTNRYVPS